MDASVDNIILDLHNSSHLLSLIQQLLIIKMSFNPPSQFQRRQISSKREFGLLVAQVGRTKGLLKRSKAVTCSPLPYGYWGGGERFSFIFSIQGTVHYLTPREQLTVLVSTVNIKLHGLTGYNLSIIIRVRYHTHTHTHTKKSGLSVLLKKQKWVRVCQRVKGCQT